MRALFWGTGFSLALFACGGAQPEAASPADETTVEAPDPGSSPPPAAEESSEDATPEPKKPEESAPEPQFTENMSVADAIKAVPPGADRKNIEPEALAKPLQDPKLFEACKPNKFKLKVAVWDGKAVGIDLATTPKSQKVHDCLVEKIKGITWPDKVKSLNTVEYQF